MAGWRQRRSGARGGVRVDGGAPGRAEGVGGLGGGVPSSGGGPRMVQRRGGAAARWHVCAVAWGRGGPAARELGRAAARAGSGVGGSGGRRRRLDGFSQERERRKNESARSRTWL